MSSAVKLYIYFWSRHSFLVILVSGKVFYLLFINSIWSFKLVLYSLKQLFLLVFESYLDERCCFISIMSYFSETIQSDLFIVFVSRIFNCRYFIHVLFTITRGNCVTIENGSTFLLFDTDLFFFQLLFQHYGQFMVIRLPSLHAAL